MNLSSAQQGFGRLTAQLRAWWTAICTPDPKPPTPTAEQRLAEAVKTAGWCIFWGLILNGCLRAQNTIEVLTK